MAKSRNGASENKDTSKGDRYFLRKRANKTTKETRNAQKALPGKPRKTAKSVAVLEATVKVKKARAIICKRTLNEARQANGRRLGLRTCIRSPRRFEPELFFVKSSPHTSSNSATVSTPVSQKRVRRRTVEISSAVIPKITRKSASKEVKTKSLRKSLLKPLIPTEDISEDGEEKEKQLRESSGEINIEPEIRRKTARRSLSTPRKPSRTLIDRSDPLLVELSGWFSAPHIDQVPSEPSQLSTSSQQSTPQSSQTPRKRLTLDSLEIVEESTSQQRLTLSQPVISENIAIGWKHKIEVSLQRSNRKATKSPSSQSTLSSQSTDCTRLHQSKQSSRRTYPSQSSQSTPLSTQSTQSTIKSSQDILPSTQPLFPLLPFPPLASPVSPTYEDSEITVYDHIEPPLEPERSRSAVQRSETLGDEEEWSDLPSTILPQLDAPFSPTSSGNESWHSARDKLELTAEGASVVASPLE